MDGITLVLIGVASILIYFLLKYRTYSATAPPGPKGYPFIGNTFQIDTKKLHISLSAFAKEYGEIYSVNVFGRNAVVLNSPELVREALLREPNASNFAARLQSYFGKEFMFNNADLVLSSNTEVWAKRRKFSHKLLKAYGEGLKIIEKKLHEALNNTICDVRKFSGAAFDPEDVITSFLVGIITSLSVVEYDEVLNEVLKPRFSFMVRTLPFLKYIPGKYKEIYERCRRAQLRFLELVKKEKDNMEGGGMIHDLYAELPKGWLTEEEIFAILTNMISAGLLTSKGTIWSMIQILISRPEVQKKLQEEVDTVVGHDRLPSLSDKSSMPYTEAVLYETLRYISHIPLAVPHSNSRDSKLKGYDIKKGSMILINVWNIHHDEEFYNKPFDFCPERFLGHDGQIEPADSPVRQSFLAFGIGKRACIGEVFAKNRIFLFLASMMQHFTFESEDGNIPEIMDPTNMVQSAVRMPQRYKCKAIERRK
ncbi:hypothetical protein KUTeg_002539 [Tegillarca granosa]|uniref:Cytochrome P450 n=1 Tax=Tegillarca granosa TaxID=220873 RepID=A0ABQ9FY66_TEGGR|nr:hypothetical protein KUTeg_002539 [Tegillarca granosa]